MNRHTLIALGVLALGVLVTVANLQDGVRFSFPLLLGALLLADGALRLMALDDDADPGATSRSLRGQRRTNSNAER